MSKLHSSKYLKEHLIFAIDAMHSNFEDHLLSIDKDREFQINLPSF